MKINVCRTQAFPEKPLCAGRKWLWVQSTAKYSPYNCFLMRCRYFQSMSAVIEGNSHFKRKKDVDGLVKRICDQNQMADPDKEVLRVALMEREKAIEEIILKDDLL